MSKSEVVTGVIGFKQRSLLRYLPFLTRTRGKFNQDYKNNGAHYIQPIDNVYATMGIRCQNCMFYRPPSACKIVNGIIYPTGVCKFWLIPEEKLT